MRGQGSFIVVAEHEEAAPSPRSRVASRAHARRWVGDRAIVVALSLRGWVLLSASLVAAGCHDWVTVRSAEVAKMEPPAAGTRGGSSPPRLLRPNGSLVEVDDDSDVVVTMTDGRELVFTHPVHARVDGDVIIVRGGNRADTRLRDGTISKVEVSKFRGGQTAVAIVATVLVCVAGVFLVLPRGNASSSAAAAR